MPSARRPTRIGSLTRFGAISRILLRHGFASFFDRRDRAPGDATRPAVRAPWPGFPSPVRLRRALEELGPSFIKLGQLLSLRADLLPRPYIEELRRLQDQVPPVPFEAVRPVVEAELGRPVEEVFAEFDPVSMAAASVAQVHRGRLPDGTEVAVKIIRPGIEKKIREDIDLMYHFATRFERRSELGRIVGLVNVVREFERTIFRELDMFIEAGSIEKFAANFDGSEEIVIPRVHWEATGRSVLTMDYMAGIKVDEVAAIRGAGLDPREIARIGLRSFSRQLLEFGFFHADPHPANTIVMPDGRVALVDFGITGYLDEETMGQVAAVFLGYARRDYGLVIDALLDAGLIDDRMDLAALRADLKDMSEVFYGRTLATIQVKDVYDQVMDLAYRYGIRFPRNLLLLFKTLIQTEALGKILGSRDSLLEAVAPQARRLLRHGVKTRARIREELRHLGRDAGSLPRYMAAILRNTVAGRQAFELRHSGFEGLDGKIEKGVNRLTVGLIIAASTIAGALILNSGRETMVFSLSFLGLHDISLTGLLGITGYSIATILGVWLIISIVRSGRL